MTLPKHICLDFDGTLVEQTEAYFASINKIFSQQGLTPPPRDVWNTAQWHDDFSMMHSYGADPDLWLAITDDYCHNFELNTVFEGSYTLLNAAREAGAKLSIATGRTTTLQRMEEILRELNILDYFDVFVTHSAMGGARIVQAAEVNKATMFEHVCESLGVPITKSWYATDNAVDAANAVVCGFEKVFGVTTGGNNPEFFTSPVIVVDSLAELINA